LGFELNFSETNAVQAKVRIVGDTALGGDLGNDGAKIMVEKLNHVDGVLAMPQHVKADFVGAAADTEEVWGAIDHVETAASSEGQRAKVDAVVSSDSASEGDSKSTPDPLRRCKRRWE
jgi:hypothetical protein